MLTIFIPKYQPQGLALVRELAREIDAIDVAVEILVMWEGNEGEIEPACVVQAKEVKYCRAIRKPRNTPSHKVRQLLFAEAKYENILLLESDVFPVYNNFLVRYVDAIQAADIVCGGTRYRNDGAKRINPLRWLYGKNYENKTAFVRAQEPYSSINTKSFLINRTFMSHLLYEDNFTVSGDRLLAIQAKRLDARVVHIENPVFHDDYDSSEEFLSKVRLSIDNICFHMEDMLDFPGLVQVYYRTKAFHMQGLLRWTYRTFEKPMRRHLLGQHPTLKVFNLYRLSYMACASEMM